MSKVRDVEDYINDVSITHNFYYDYSLVDYKNAHKKIKIICPLHGIFEQTPLNHKKYGCKKCGKLLDEYEILDKLKKIHKNRYSYANFKYLGMYKKSHIICSIHGDFEQTVLNHVSGKGCPKCASNYKKEKEEIINKLNILHNNKYDYSQTIFKRTKDIVSIICPKHNEFKQILNNHLRGHGCPVCDESKGERTIEKYLIDNDIIFERQKKFELCKDKNKLPFDFYLNDYNLCVEFDGEQHFYDVSNWKNFNYTKKHDLIKTEFCVKNKIKLCRISYEENIIEKLEEQIKQK